MGVTHDYPAVFQREETIAETALIWLREKGRVNAPYFNIVDFVRDIMAGRIRLKKGPLLLKFIDAEKEGLPAYVTVEPLTLHIDKEIWDLADKGDPDSRYIIAHELGHVIMHGHYPKAAFSSDKAAQLKILVNEQSAEWQANIFADYFLLPDHLAANFSSPKEIASACSAPSEVAERRFNKLEEARLRKKVPAGVCSFCGDFFCNGLH